jgi:hypothetical protein
VTDATIHQLLQQQGLTSSDLAWFESLNWDDAAVREGKMAAALGAKLADLRDPDEDEDE